MNAIQILLIEDNPGDVRLTREALSEGKLKNNLNVCGDGEDALNYLLKLPPHENATTPHLILLDLNLPKLNGRELLEKIKADPRLKTIPVVVLTTSKSEEDVLKSYQLNANCFITKPVDFERFAEVVQKIKDFWFTIVILPEQFQ